MTTLRFGLSVYKKRLKVTFLCLLVFQVYTLMGLFYYKFNQLIVDYVLLGGDGASGKEGLFNFLIDGRFGAYGTWSLFFAIAISYALFMLIRHACYYFYMVVSQYEGQNFEGDIRRMTMRKLLDQSTNVLNKYNTGELLTLLNFDSSHFRLFFVNSMPDIFNYVCRIIYCFIFLAAIHPLLMIPTAVIAPVLFLIGHRYVRAANRVNKDIRTANSDLNMCVQENINAVRIIRSNASEDIEMQKFDKQNENTRNAYFRHVETVTRYGIAFNCIRWFIYLGSIGLGAYLATIGKISIGDFSAFVSYGIIIMNAIIILVSSLFNGQQYLIAGGKIKEFLDGKEQIQEAEYPMPVLGAPHIEINDVSLSIDGTKVLDHVSLDIPYGKRIGIIGATGSGKSMLFRLINRFVDPDEGEVLLNDENIKEYSVNEVRRQFGFVLQDVFLFSDTVANNISYYNEHANMNTVKKCAQIAQADEFIQGLSDGYDTVIGERGVGLSGGQKQRLSIARALLKKAPVLIFDSATSALDTETEQRVFEGIKKHYRGITLLISTHRISALQDMDEIIYMDGGKIVERGTHEQLLALQGHYYHTYVAQQTSLSEVTL